MSDTRMACAAHQPTPHRGDPMNTDALRRRLQALRGIRTGGSIPAVLAQVQGDLQTVIEAVLELAGEDDEHEPVTDGPAVGEQVTDREGDVWQRFEGGWLWWDEGGGDWSFLRRTWDDLQTYYAPLRATTDDDRRRVGLPVRDENTPPASQNGPQDARSADSGIGGPPEPENGAQGRIGWLRMVPSEESRDLMREVPGGWTELDIDDDVLVWTAERYPDAEFTPIPTLADDEVAVKREVLDMVMERLECARLAAMEDRRTATANALQHTIDALEAGR